MKTTLVYGVMIWLIMSCKTAAVPERKESDIGVSALSNGSYYIILANSGRALTANAPSGGQNVFLRSFSRSGTQKWVLQLKGKNAVIRLCGHDDLLFQPHPSVSDGTPVISSDFMGGESTQFRIEPSGRPGLWKIRSVNLNNDALQGVQGSEELRFSGITSNNNQQLWKLVHADCR